MGYCPAKKFEKDNKFKDLQHRIRVYEILDDTTAPLKAIRALVAYLNDKNVELKTLNPKDYNSSIGHFGLFREKFKDSLWKEALTFFKKPDLKLVT